jgi:hypothetical protein
MSYSSLNGTGQDSNPIKIILEHCNDVTEDLMYKVNRHKLESRGVNIINVIITSLNLLRCSGYGFTAYHDQLNRDVSSIRYNAVLRQRTINERQRDDIDYLQDAFAPIPQDYTWSVNLAPDESTIKWMLEFYHDFFKERQFNSWIQPVRILLQANMLIVEGWYDVY